MKTTGYRLLSTMFAAAVMAATLPAPAEDDSSKGTPMAPIPADFKRVRRPMARMAELPITGDSRLARMSHSKKRRTPAQGRRPSSGIRQTHVRTNEPRRSVSKLFVSHGRCMTGERRVPPITQIDISRYISRRRNRRGRSPYTRKAAWRICRCRCSSADW